MQVVIVWDGMDAVFFNGRLNCVPRVGERVRFRRAEMNFPEVYVVVDVTYRIGRVIETNTDPVGHNVTAHVTVSAEV